MRRRTFVLSLVACAALPAASLMATVIPPIGLAPGSQYQLIFVTASARDAVSIDIADYNTFVSDESDQGVPFGLPAGATWHAVASTETVNANDNAPSGVFPVYNTAGQLVSAPGVGIYTGALDNLVAYDQFGELATIAQEENVWTGSDFQGFGIPDGTLAASGGLTEVGHFALDGTWLEFALAPQFGEVTFSKPLYALSTALTVPVPEPATILLLAVAILLGAGHHLLRWRLQPALVPSASRPATTTGEDRGVV